jgi:hypothetical protein
MITKTDSLSVLIKKADAAFSSFIRKRDAHPDGRIRCFICEKPVPWKSSHCGHFLDRDQMPVRYDEMNAHAVCFECNCIDPRHKERYTSTMVSKYGLEAVQELVDKSRSLAKFARFELEEIISTYKEKLKAL